jgi:hypothetical protein
VSKPVSPNIEKRAIPRRPKDVSELGARIAVGDPASAPQEFLILLSHKLSRWCRVSWRSDREIGIEFVG